VGPRELWISTEQDHKGVLVTVRDSGPGIDSDNRKRVFESFYITKSNGIGGLPICRSIIKGLGASYGPSRIHFAALCFSSPFRALKTKW
jgi:C4-dicarboxylate-specific signal transduction histidine kinase